MAKKTSRLIRELLATAKDMREVGVMSRETYKKITLRHLKGAPKVAPVTGAQIRSMRVRAKLNQGVFASYLNVSTGYLSQLERGVKEPTGAASTFGDARFKQPIAKALGRRVTPLPRGRRRNAKGEWRHLSLL
jgi:putative transcriptional regulator